ncbi:hypothetical protein E2C01_002472 [Portunus trituberculatus]|uniref:Uncharacterized protein n=1 Tax=Portunus trituberculatus TaxID=210409 RepID=A0A5B7CQU1_PORTR|nr:hypothetical protein [Portunus trituberculatus]
MTAASVKVQASCQVFLSLTGCAALRPVSSVDTKPFGHRGRPRASGFPDLTFPERNKKSKSRTWRQVWPTTLFRFGLPDSLAPENLITTTTITTTTLCLVIANHCLVTSWIRIKDAAPGLFLL